MNDTSSATCARPQASGPQRPIEADSSVSVMSSACLALRSGNSACGECVEACPTSSIQHGENGFSIDAGCLSCGRCAAACPSGALAVKGFEFARPLPDGNFVRVECWKLPAALAGPDAIRVPCLGGVSPSQWLALAEEAGSRQVAVIDRGWCAECRAGANCRPQHPAQRALDRALALLVATGWPEARRPFVRREPLPSGAMPELIPIERPASLARRAFFRRLGSEVQRAVGEQQAVQETTPRALRGRGMSMPERERLIDTARRLATAAGRALPSTLFVAVRLSQACDNHQLCARLCPTGALAPYDRDGVSGVEFDAALCTDCGLCVRSCPQQAISVTPAGECPDADAPLVLSAFGERHCTRCQGPFHDAHGSALCPACARAHQLGSALFGAASLFASKTMSVVSSSGEVNHE